MATIEEYRASQEAMEKLRARHVSDAFKEAAGDDFTPGQLAALMEDLDLAKFIGEDGEVAKTRVTKLLGQLGGTAAPAADAPKSRGRRVKDVQAERAAARDAKTKRTA